MKHAVQKRINQSMGSTDQVGRADLEPSVQDQKRSTPVGAGEREQLRNPQAVQPVKQIPIQSLAEWANESLDHARETFVDKTYKEKCHAFREFFQEIDQNLSCEDLNSGMVLSYLQKAKRTRSGYGANKSRKNLRAAWEWGSLFWEMPERNPFHRVPKFAEERDERVVPSWRDSSRYSKSLRTIQIGACCLPISRPEPEGMNSSGCSGRMSI